MLLRFEVSNYRSILDPVELSMIAVDKDREATRGFELLDERVLTVAGVYGPNASGKSNLLDSLAWLSDAVDSSLSRWQSEIPQDPHRFWRGPESPTTFEVEIMINEVRHEYYLEFSNEVLYESLHSYPKRRRRMLFEREGKEIRFRAGYEAGGIRSLLTPTNLALSAAIRLDHELSPIGHLLSNIVVFGLGERRRRHRPPSFPSLSPYYSMLWFLDDKNKYLGPRSEIDTPQYDPLKLLQSADPSIDNVKFTETDNDDWPPFRRIWFVRSFEGEPVELEYDQESVGTQVWFDIVGPVIEVLTRGGILLFDEIDASLHPQIAIYLIELFQDPQLNPKNAQLIFTSHDISLLNNLNRDEVWLTEKDSRGMTDLVAIAQYKGERVRKSLNLGRAYLHGRFGALPEVGQTIPRQHLALIGQDS